MLSVFQLKIAGTRVIGGFRILRRSAKCTKWILCNNYGNIGISWNLHDSELRKRVSKHILQHLLKLSHFYTLYFCLVVVLSLARRTWVSTSLASLRYWTVHFVHKHSNILSINTTKLHLPAYAHADILRSDFSYWLKDKFQAGADLVITIKIVTWSGAQLCVLITSWGIKYHIRWLAFT